MDRVIWHQFKQEVRDRLDFADYWNRVHSQSVDPQLQAQVAEVLALRLDPVGKVVVKLVKFGGGVPEYLEFGGVAELSAWYQADWDWTGIESVEVVRHSSFEGTRACGQQKLRGFL